MKKSKLYGVLLTAFLMGISCVDGNEPIESQIEEAASKKHFPGTEWERIDDVKAAGWSEAKLQEAADYASSLNTAAYVVVHKGRIVQEFGQTEKKYKCHSIRKSFLSALYGIHVHEGRINLESTMEELGIDDNPPALSKQEKQATIDMLLKARSGIYHPALYETKAMAASRPARHSHAPGTFYYYNNWDFNALGTIFEQQLGVSIFEDFHQRIAQPIGMESFNPQTDCEYFHGAASIHPAYLFEMNTLDMARFGLLFARNGKWQDQEIIPADWVRASVTSYSDAKSKGGYGYLWWVAEDGRHFGGSYKAPEGLYTARGSGGHVIAVIPELDFVLVHRADTFVSNKRVSYTQVGYLLEKILAAYEN